MLLTHCSHSRWKPQTAPIGKSKSLVVESLGSPERSWRKKGKDYWYYNPNSDHAADKAILVFENGVLIERIQPGKDTDFNELEAELKKLKPQDPGKFETLSE